MNELIYTEPTFVVTPPKIELPPIPANVVQKTKTIDGVNYTYSIYPLVDQFHPALTKECSPFDFRILAIDPRFLAISLIETMVKHGGVGLAAPQIGLSYRVFVMGAGNRAFACYNPEVIETEGEDDFEEGCLSFRGLYLRIRRPSKIKVKYQDMVGQFHEETFDGLTARTFLHELDHLNGIVYTSLVSQYILDKAKTKVKGNVKKLDAQKQAMIKQQIINKATQKVVEEQKAKELQEKLNSSIPSDILLNVLDKPQTDQ